jgi:hypothetical protein
MDNLGWIFGSILGYGSPFIILMCIAFVVAKSTKKSWPYPIAIILAVLFYAAIITGLNYIESKKIQNLSNNFDTYNLQKTS